MMMKGIKCPPLPPSEAKFGRNKSFYSKFLIIASPLNFRQKSCQPNISVTNVTNTKNEDKTQT